MDDLKDLGISIHGKIKCPLAISWIALLLQTFLLMFYISGGDYISVWECIFNILLALSLQIIAVLLSISNNINSEKIYKFLKLSFILSAVNIALAIISYVFLLCSFNYKMRGFLGTTPIGEALLTAEKVLVGFVAFIVRLVEALPFLIFLCYRNIFFQKNEEIGEEGLMPQKNRSVRDSELGLIQDAEINQN